jgi:hypothetical protein
MLRTKPRDSKRNKKRPKSKPLVAMLPQDANIARSSTEELVMKREKRASTV